MSGPYPVLGISTSGAETAQQWLQAVSHNIANVNTVRPAGQQPFRAQQLYVNTREEGGVEVTGLGESQDVAQRTFDPDNPLADAQGFVTLPVVDLGAQMSDMLMAQRMFQVNLAVHQTGIDTYRAALRIGSGS